MDGRGAALRLRGESLQQGSRGGPMIEYFADRMQGKWVAMLTVASIVYGVFTLNVLPWWGRLNAAQGGTELQSTFSYGAEEVARVFTSFDPSLRADALAFYVVDVPNAVLFGTSIAALIGFALRLLRAQQTPLRWLIALPLISGASDLIENLCLTLALTVSPDAPSLFGGLAGVSTTAKLATGFTSIALMLLLLLSGLARAAWLKARGEPRRQ